MLYDWILIIEAPHKHEALDNEVRIEYTMETVHAPPAAGDHFLVTLVKPPMHTKHTSRAVVRDVVWGFEFDGSTRTWWGPTVFAQLD